LIFDFGADFGNPGPGLEWAYKMFGGVKPVNEIPIDPLNNWIRAY
jgi:hypothetical protein